MDSTTLMTKFYLTAAISFNGLWMECLSPKALVWSTSAWDRYWLFRLQMRPGVHGSRHPSPAAPLDHRVCLWGAQHLWPLLGLQLLGSLSWNPPSGLTPPPWCPHFCPAATSFPAPQHTRPPRTILQNYSPSQKSSHELPPATDLHFLPLRPISSNLCVSSFHSLHFTCLSFTYTWQVCVLIVSQPSGGRSYLVGKVKGACIRRV